MVDREASNGGSPRRRVTHKNRSVPLEMLVPRVATRVKELGRHRGRRIDACKIRALMGVASEATEAQVVERGGAAVLLSDHMIDREREERVVVFVNPAVSIRTVRRPCPGLAPGAERPSGRSVLAQHPAGLGLKDRDEGAGRHAGVVFLSLRIGQCSRGRLAGQKLHAAVGISR